MAVADAIRCVSFTMIPPVGGLMGRAGLFSRGRLRSVDAVVARFIPPTSPQSTFRGNVSVITAT